jgi:hypothetical protein
LSPSWLGLAPLGLGRIGPASHACDRVARRVSTRVSLRQEIFVDFVFVAFVAAAAAADILPPLHLAYTAMSRIRCAAPTHLVNLPKRFEELLTARGQLGLHIALELRPRHRRGRGPPGGSQRCSQCSPLHERIHGRGHAVAIAIAVSLVRFRLALVLSRMLRLNRGIEARSDFQRLATARIIE